MPAVIVAAAALWIDEAKVRRIRGPRGLASLLGRRNGHSAVAAAHGVQIATEDAREARGLCHPGQLRQRGRSQSVRASIVPGLQVNGDDLDVLPGREGETLGKTRPQ